MANRPVLALAVVLFGLLMIATGLGYTVKQASVYGPPSADEGRDSLRDDANSPAHREAWLPYRSEASGSDIDPLPGDSINPSERSDVHPPSNFILPALSLLSGAVLAAIGAIALMHRWRGIGIR